MYKQNVQKYFENISKITPQYFQSITHLQEECMKACEKTINASVAMSQEIAKKSGITSEVPSSAKTAFVDAFNDNVNAFADLNKNIIQSWITPFTQKN
jgi:ABC-type Fe3+/spermidine/putrescine transport system ATPase subunit